MATASDLLPETWFVNPPLWALQTQHRHLALACGDACKYFRDVAPFAAVAERSVAAMEQLHSLMAPGESVWVFGEDYPAIPQLIVEEMLPCLQMVLAGNVEPSEPVGEIVELSAGDSPAMVALTDLAFPGFFRPRTHEMGSYYGVRLGGALVAMGGERLKLDGYAEVSGVCTHPDHRGKGYAANIIWTVVHEQRRAGAVSWLHVGAANRHAIELYLRMGFEIARPVTVTRISRKV